MAQGFDPYHTWLGIRPEEQPPNHYRLLGIALFEDDASVIANAADQRMVYLRTFQSGKHSALSQRLLNEVAAANLCLLNTRKKAAYDAKLRQTIEAASPQPGGELAEVFQQAENASISKPRRRRRSQNTGALIGVVVFGLVVVIGAGLYVSGAFNELLALIDSGDAQPATPAAASAARPAGPPRLRMPPGAMDLLAIFDPLRNTLAGQWSREGAILVGSAAARLAFPQPVTPEYDLTVVAQRTQGNNALIVILPIGSKQVAAVLDGDGAKFSGLSGIDGRGFRENDTSKPGPQLPDDRYFTAVFSVRADRINVTVDGRAVIDWTGAANRVQVPSGWGTPDPREIGLMVVSSFRFSQVFLAPVGSLAPPSSRPSPQAAARALPALPNRAPEPSPDLPPVVAPTIPTLGRSPAPDADKQQQALKLLEERFKTADAKQAADKVKLARELVDAVQTVNDPVERFVSLRKAAELAADGGDPVLMVSVVDRLADQFEFNALAAKVTLMETVAGTTTDAEQFKLLIDGFQTLAAEAIKAREFDLGEQLGVAVLKACARPEGRVYRKQVAAQRLATAKAREDWRTVERQMETLKTRPDDPEANLAAGRWICLVEGDWPKGLPHLAKGSIPVWREAAERELKGPADAAGMAAIGDGWWDLAGRERLEARDALRDHAAQWYERAMVGADGPLKARLEKRLLEAATPAAAAR